jgi:predicted phosphodiesterase
MLRAAMLVKPDIIVILGDFADGEALSAHPPTKPGERDFEDEIQSVSKALDQLDALGAAKKVYVEGNHEFRLDRYLMERAPGLFRSIRWQNLLELYRRGWDWVPYRKSTKVGKLHITHDTGSAGMNAHRVSSKAFGGSAVIGHTHRMSYEVTGRFDGPPYLAAMLGWLGDPEKAAGYIHEAKASDWVHGFGVAYIEPDGITHLQPVPIVNGRCVVQGRLVT